MHQNYVVFVIVLLVLVAPQVSAAGAAPASQPASQPASRPIASRPAASQPVARVFNQGKDVKSAGWTISVLSSSYTLGKRPGDTSGKERMYVKMEVRFTNTGSKSGYTPAVEVEDANRNRFTGIDVIGYLVSAGNHLTRKFTFDIPSRRQLRLTWTDANGQTWWIALKPKLQVER